MYKEDFIRKIADILNVKYAQIDEATNLKNLEEYDSLALIAILLFINEKFALTIPPSDLNSVTTVKTLMELIGLEKFK